MRFLGRAALICALAAPGAAWVPGPAAAAAETFTSPPVVGGAATTSIGALLRQPGVATGLRDVRLLDSFYRALGYRPAWQGPTGWTVEAWTARSGDQDSPRRRQLVFCARSRRTSHRSGCRLGRLQPRWHLDEQPL